MTYEQANAALVLLKRLNEWGAQTGTWEADVWKDLAVFLSRVRRGLPPDQPDD